MLALQPVNPSAGADIQANQRLGGLRNGKSRSRYDRRADKQASEFHETSFIFL
jgi:hypothetical protein